MTVRIKKLEKPPKEWDIGYFTTSDDKDIRYAVIAPCKEQKNKGKVVLTGGYGLDIEYYCKAIKNWSRRGFEVYAMDLYGQGGSARENPEKPLLPCTLGFEAHAEILNEFIDKVVQPDPAQINILSAHSQSGGIVPVYLERYEKKENFPFNMAVLGSPLFALNTFGETPGKLFRAFVYAADYCGFGDMTLKIEPPARFKIALQKAATKLKMDFQNATANTEDIANDNPPLTARVSFRNDDYPAEMGYPTVKWFKSFYESEKNLTTAFYKSIQTPVLIVSPTEDEYVSIKAKEHAAGHLANAETVSIPEARHGIWYDRSNTIQEQLWNVIDRFVQKHTGDHKPCCHKITAISPRKEGARLMAS